MPTRRLYGDFQTEGVDGFLFYERWSFKAFFFRRATRYEMDESWIHSYTAQNQLFTSFLLYATLLRRFRPIPLFYIFYTRNAFRGFQAIDPSWFYRLPIIANFSELQYSDRDQATL